MSQLTQFGGRFCRNASIPSRASSETNSSADCSVSASACAVECIQDRRRSSTPSTRPVPAASPSRSRRSARRQLPLTSSAATVTSPISAAASAPELLAGHEVAARGARRHLRQQRQRDDRRRHADARLGQRERAAASRDDDVARPDEPEPAGPHVPVDRRRSPASAARGSRRSRCVSSRALSTATSRRDRAPLASDRSAPAQNVPPVWPSTTARTAGVVGRVGEALRAAARPAPWTARCGCAASPASAARPRPSTA